ncbi:MAG: ATP-binding protein [Rhodothermales bacterium]
MANPFEYGGVVAESGFCNRGQEMEDLRRAAENGDRLLIYAERRMGKTSLVQRVLRKLPPRRYLPVYVDVWPTHDAASLAAGIAKAVTSAAETKADRILTTAKDVFRHLVPSLTLDDADNPSVQFGARSGIAPQPQLEDALDGIQRLAETRDQRFVVVLDEIQRLGEYGEDLAERVLRSRIQMHQGIAYFFLGSRKHLVEQMFTDTTRPLFQSAGHYPLEAIATDDWLPFISERFFRSLKRIPDEVVRELCARTGGHPYYTQHFAHVLWEISPQDQDVTPADLDRAESVLLDRLAYTYTVLWEMLTTNQRLLLQGMAAEEDDIQPFSSAFLKRIDMAQSSAHTAARAMLERDVLDRTPDGYVISDRFFRLWIWKTTRR